jgi:hypothetical protein
MGVWTATPRTWVAGEVPTATHFNENVRDFGRAFSDAWTLYTPTLTASTTSPTNWTQTGYYMQAGKLVHVKGTLTAGASMTAGSGTYRIALPVNASATLANAVCNSTVNIYDSSANIAWSTPFAWIAAATYVQLQYANGAASVNITNAAPWIWAANDIIQFAFTYEAA